MNRNVIIIGASGHGKVIADIILSSGDNVVGFLDDNPEVKEFIGFPVLGKLEDYSKYPEAEFIIAIGNADIRERIAEKMKGVRFYTAVHPSAVISSIDTVIGEGTAIMANTVVNAGSTVGRHCIINTSAVVEHDNTIEDFAHISVGAHLAGTVHIGRKTWIGVGATVKNNISICSDCMIGAGTVVISNINEKGTYIGVPAMKYEKVNGGGYVK